MRLPETSSLKKKNQGVLPHADAFDAHLNGAEERTRLAADYLEGLAWEIYGAPNEETLKSLQVMAAESGLGISVYPDNFGGYLRASLD